MESLHSMTLPAAFQEVQNTKGKRILKIALRTACSSPYAKQIAWSAINRLRSDLMSKRTRRLCVFLSCMAMIHAIAATSTGTEHGALKSVSIFLEGDSSSIPKFINVCRQMGPERGLEFHFADKQSDKYDYRVILSAEGASAWDFAHGNIVVMTPEAKVLFTVTRSSRWTSKGTTNAMGKEFVKEMARYLDTHK